MMEALKPLASLVLSGAGFTLVAAALLDFLYYRLPNKLFYIIFYLFPLYIILSLKFHLVSNYSVFVGAMIVGFTLFSLGLIGGGDAKLFAAVSLWAGWDNMAPFLIYMIAAGGAVAAAYLFFPHHIHGLSARMRGYIHERTPLKKIVRLFVPDEEIIGKEIVSLQQQRMIPYGISIAVAGLATLLKGVP